MTDAIPEWAMQIARETIIDCRKSNTDTLAEFVARALMAADKAATERIERETIERMWKYLQTRKSFGDGKWAAEHALRMPLKYAAAIRKGTE